MVESPNAISFEAARRSTAVHGSGASRTSWNSTGSAGGGFDRGVDAGGVGVEEPRRSVRDLALLALGDAAHPDRSHQHVGLQGVRARELGQAPGGRAAEELELPQPVLAVAEPQREARVGSAARAHVRNAEAVAEDLDGRVEAAKPQTAGRLRQRALEELVPEAEARAREHAARGAGDQALFRGHWHDPDSFRRARS